MILLSNTFPVVGNGLGGLPDAIECVVSHEINGIYELQMRYPVTGQHFDEIESGRFIMAKPDDLTPAQPFRVYRITKPLNGVVTVYARHICYDMQGIIAEPFTAGSLTEAFQTLPTVLTPANSFSFQTTRSVASGITLAEPRPLWKLLGGQAGSFLDVYGGEWDFDGYNVKLLTRLGTDRGVTIRYGKNMTDLEQDATIEAAYSGVYPYWYDEESNTLVTLPEKFVAVTGAVVSDRVMMLDCSGDFDDAPTEAQLRARANAYITANSVGNAKTSWKISFVSSNGYEDDLRLLEQVQLGDTLSVYYERLNVNATARAVKTEYDVLAERYKAVTLGRVKQNLAQIIVSNQEQTASQFSEVKSDIEHAVDGATDFIRHGEGYMRFIYNAADELTEIVSLDDPDITQALSVWRWNNGGFGHSSTGYNGPYTLAITQNGAIVADFITAGTLNANVIRAGILQDTQGYNSWNLQTGAFTITNGTIHISTTSQEYDTIFLSWNDGGSNNVQSSMQSGGFSVRDRNNAQKRWYELDRWGFEERQDNAAGTASPSISRLANAILRVGSDAAAVSSGVNVGGDIYVNDTNGIERTHIGPNGEIFLYDTTPTLRTKIDGAGRLWQYDTNGTMRQKLESNGALWQYDANGKQRTYLEYGDIMLYTSAEKQTAKLSGSAFASGGSLELYDTNAAERARLLIDGLSFYNASGSMTAIYPATYTNHNNTTVGSNPTYVESQNVRWTKMGHVVTLSGWFQMTGTTPSVGTWLLANLPPTVHELDFTVYDQNSQTTRMVVLRNDGKLYAAHGMATSGLSLHYMNVAITYICTDATQ